MSTEILVPFQLTPYGSVATTGDPNVQAVQHINSICGTSPGERVMRPNYGVPLKKYVFAPGVNFTAQEITQEVQDQLAIWEPSISVTSVTPVADESSGVADVNVAFSLNPGAARSSVNMATVSLGGTVAETVVTTS